MTKGQFSLLEQDLADQRQKDFQEEQQIFRKIDQAFYALIDAVQERWPGDYFRDYIPGRLIQEYPQQTTDKRDSKRIVSKTLRRQVFERDAYRCQHCNDHHKLQADHIIPFSKGGLTELDNLQTLCGPCNVAKGVQHGH